MWCENMTRLSFEDEIVEDEEGQYFSRASLESNPRPHRSTNRSSPSLTSVLSFVSSRRSFTYDRLAYCPIQLTITKLDGSSFEVEVPRSATVADIKQAIQTCFNYLPTEGPGKISWQQLWGHFCLSHKGQKLLDDNEHIKDLSIKDGDELQFVRHISADTLLRNQSKKRIADSKTYTIIQNEEEEEEEAQREKEVAGDLEDLIYEAYGQDMEDYSFEHESNSCNLFRSWFQFLRINLAGKCGGGFVEFFTGVFHCFGNRQPIYSSRVSQVEI